MKNIDHARLAVIAAQEVEKPDFPVEEFQDLLKEIGEAASSTTKACLLAIHVFNEARTALMWKFSGKRTAIKNNGVARCVSRYVNEGTA